MTKKQRAIFELVVGIPAFIVFGYFTDMWAAIALFFAMMANNVGRRDL
jgi:uncharacterized membrane protein YphA (DoxX/SURF4 family)